MVEEIRNDRQMRALTGQSLEKFNELLSAFSRVYEQERYKAYEKGLAEGTRKRKPGGGQKGKLPGMVDKLYLILTYYKTYPTFDVLGSRFGIARSKANERVHYLSPILHQTLVEMGHLPNRKFESIEDFREAIGNLDQILIDVTERPHQRPQDNERQQALYSGKKNDIPSRT